MYLYYLIKYIYIYICMPITQKRQEEGSLQWSKGGLYNNQENTIVRNTANKVSRICIYPTPLHEQDATQDQLLSGDLGGVLVV